jgi:5-methylcytosine-specific restriction endonuclease McrA
MNALQRWTAAVMELDDYTCQLCGTCKHLDAHHIIARSQDPSKALDPANGITLCRRDHD